MSLSLLINHFDIAIRKPEDVARLKQLILQLAVRGRLVAQDPNDEPAEVLLERIAVQSGLRFPEDTDQVVSLLPAGWAWVQLRLLGEVFGGKTPSTARADYWDGEIPWVTPKDMWADFVCDTQLKLTQKAVDQTSMRMVPSGSLLIVARSGILKRKLPVSINQCECTVNQDLKVLVPHVPETNRYLQLMLRGHQELILTQLVKTGTTVQSLKYTQFERHLFPLPPLAEQHRIVARVDELLVAADELAGRLATAGERRRRYHTAALAQLTRPTVDALSPVLSSSLITHFDRLYADPAAVAELKQAILQLAVMGRLVAQDAGDEPAGVLLEKVIGKKEFIDQAPFEIPANWVWSRVERLCYKVQDGTHFSPQKQYSIPGEGRYLYLTSKNIKDAGIDLSDVSYIDEEVHRPIFQRCNPEKGDVLLIKDGAKTGVVTINNIDEEFSLLSSVAVLKPVRNILVSTYLQYFFRSPIGFELVTGKMTGSAIQRIVLNKIRSSLVALPPLSEQHRIVARVDELFALADAAAGRGAAAEEARERFLGTVVGGTVLNTGGLIQV